MPSDTKQRRQIRTAISASIRVAWQDRLGRDKYATVHSFDISSEGIRMQMPEPVDLRSVLALQSQDLKLNGSASVRYCTRARGHYVVGAEFVGGLRWQPPA
jgi:hypothetical protein